MSTVLTLTLPSTASAVEAWLAACEAAPCPPLWARLARTAIDRGWPESADGWSSDQLVEVLNTASLLSDAAGAPASNRLLIGSRMSYSTVSETEVELDGLTLTISGPSAASVVRRALAAASAADVGIEIPAEMLELAIAEEQRRSSVIAENRLRAAASQAAARGRRYEACTDDDGVEIVRHYEAADEEV